MLSKKKFKIGVIGLGYVGQPLLIELSNYFSVIGFDLNNKKIDKINRLKISKLNKISVYDNIKRLQKCNIFIVCVPTPIYSNKKPNLSFLQKACEQISTIIKKNDIIIFESTVYPGTTEDYCVPIIESNSDLKYNKDFFCGYSPERINPGDKKYSLKNIKKITSGSNKKTLNIVNFIYKTIIKAGIFPVLNIKIAEAAKVIENSQRDINIAFVNELSIIFKKMNININEVLEAAETKWNFLNFKPGLVGGHCIGVDPYYLSYISRKYGYTPKVILSGRNTNDSMPKFYVNSIYEKLNINKSKRYSKKILILGLTFKENIDDVRNSKVINIIRLLNKNFGYIDVYDPYVKIFNKKNIKFNLVNYPKKNYYDIILLTVAHNEFINLGIRNIIKFKKNKGTIFDIKNTFKKNTEVVNI